MTGMEATLKMVEKEEEECTPETCGKKECKKAGKCMMEEEDD